ncbi:MAG: tail fiber domain-containing protein [candidate division Zixibacteria bacterium]
MPALRVKGFGLILIIIVAIISIAGIVSAQDSRPISYQGLLLNSLGDPVGDSFFDITFSLYEYAAEGEAIWTEEHPQVATNDGNFSARLGSITPIPLTTLQMENLYLEIQVAGDQPMSPRIPMADIPRGSIARRLHGDIFTNQSLLKIHPPDPGAQNGIAIGSYNDSNFVNLYPIHPPEPGLGPVIAVNNSPSSGASLLMFNPQPEPPAISDPWIALNTGVNSGASLLMFNPQPEPPAYPLLEMNTMTTEVSFEMTAPAYGGAGARLTNPMLSLRAENSGGSFRMFTPDIGTDPVMEMNSGTDGSWNWLMFNPQPEPPARPISKMSTGVGGEFSWLMFNPQPEPPALIMGMQTSAAGPSFEMTAPAYGGAGASLANPMLSLRAENTGANFSMFSPEFGRSAGPVMEMNSGTDGSWNWLMFNPQPEPPARPISQMSTGVGGEFSWIMFNPQPEPPAMIMGMQTSAVGPSFEMTAPQGQGGGLQITDPMLQMTADSSGAQINLKRIFMDVTGGADSTGLRLSSDSLEAKMEMFGPGSNGVPTVEIFADLNGGKIGLNTHPSNVITVARQSPTDPIASAWTTYSSRRWKKNIKTIESPLAKVMSLRGVSYDWKDNGRNDIGLIAEEVGEVLPELVTYEDNGIDARSVDYSRLVPLLIEATKEQQKTIEGLQSEIAELKSLIKGIEKPTKGSFTSASK